MSEYETEYEMLYGERYLLEILLCLIENFMNLKYHCNSNREIIRVILTLIDNHEYHKISIIIKFFLKKIMI